MTFRAHYMKCRKPANLYSSRKVATAVKDLQRNPRGKGILNLGYELVIYPD